MYTVPTVYAILYRFHKFDDVMTLLAYNWKHFFLLSRWENAQSHKNPYVFIYINDNNFRTIYADGSLFRHGGTTNGAIIIDHAR